MNFDPGLMGPKILGYVPPPPWIICTLLARSVGTSVLNHANAGCHEQKKYNESSEPFAWRVSRNACQATHVITRICMSSETMTCLFPKHVVVSLAKSNLASLGEVLDERTEYATISRPYMKTILTHEFLVWCGHCCKTATSPGLWDLHRANQGRTSHIPSSWPV